MSRRSELMLETEVMKLRHENSQLRKAARDGGGYRGRISRAYQDALQLAVYHMGFENTGRAVSVDSLGLTKRRWENAIALLKLAKLHNGRRWKSYDLVEIEQKLEQAKATALACPWLYRVQLPAYMQNGRR